MRKSNISNIKQKARNLRRNSTDAEMKLWQLLRNRRFDGYKFRRQYWIQNYIVDFVCLEKRLIVELDGGQHTEQTCYDKKRSQYLESLEFKVLRFWNDEIFNDTDEVVEEIYRNLR